MKVKIQPVVFGGIDWTSRAKLGLDPRPTPLETAEKKLSECREQLRNAELLELCEVNSPDETGKLVEVSRRADMVLAVACELLVVRSAAKALSAVEVPVVLIGRKDQPTAVFCDVCGALKADGHNAYFALDLDHLQSIVDAVYARKTLANSTALLIGDGYPSHSQVANPGTPRTVQEKVGLKIVQQSIDELKVKFDAADENEARARAQAWLDGATDVAEEARRDIVQAAKVYLAMRAMIEEAGANVFTIDCRSWDLWSCEKFHAFYSPCMGLTTLRWEGIPAACEADICAMLAMHTLSSISGLPAFMGNIGRVNRGKGSIEVAGHASCTVNMDGKNNELEGYRLRDYGGRGGVASYCSVEGGKDITIARFDKNLNNISVAAGRTIPTERCFEIVVDDVEDFVYRCIVGDHYAVVCGNHLKEVAILADMLGIGILTPTRSIPPF